MQSRRDWLKRTLLLTATLPVTASLSERLMAAPWSKTERAFFNTRITSPIRIRLNSNENPYGPSELARNAIVQQLTEANRYPFQMVEEVRDLIAAKEGVSRDHIRIGAGSGDMLCATGAAFGIEKGKIVAPYPTFPMLMAYAEVFNCNWDKVDLNEKLEIDYEALESRINNDTRLVFVCNPNNPTGTLVDPEKVMAFCERVSARVPVYADEAYLEFLDPALQRSMIDLVKKGKDVIVSKTFSKIHGLAGLRVGYIVAKPERIAQISRYHPGIPNNQLGLAAAKVALTDKAFMELSRLRNAEARKHLTDFLDTKKLFYGDSHTNFVFFDANTDGLGVMTKLAESGIGIRVVDYKGKQWCRVSVGTLEEMKILTRALQNIFS